MKTTDSFFKVILCFVSLFWGCKEKELTTLQKLYNMYERGEISECSYKGRMFYSATFNMTDASTFIYDMDCNHIGTCDYAWGSRIDSICFLSANCEVIYRVSDNIWGLPAIDKYGLGKR